MSLGGFTAASYIALWLVVIVQTLVLFEMLRQIGILRRRMPPEPGALLIDEGLSRGTSAPALVSRDLQTHEPFAVDRLRGQPAVLAFLTPSCVGCHALAPDLAQFAQDQAREIKVVIICPDSSESCLQFARQYELQTPIIADEDLTISRAFHVQRTPSATVLDAEGRVLIHGIPNSLSQLEGLLMEEGTPMASKQWMDSEHRQRGKEVTSNAAR